MSPHLPGEKAASAYDERPPWRAGWCGLPRSGSGEGDATIHILKVEGGQTPAQNEVLDQARQTPAQNEVLVQTNTNSPEVLVLLDKHQSNVRP